MPSRRSFIKSAGLLPLAAAGVVPAAVADLVGDPNDLKIKTRVNGEIRQSATTRDMIFDCKTLISCISKHFELEPGDIIFTGTPPGVILGLPKDKQIWLKPGKARQIEIRARVSGSVFAHEAGCGPS